MGKCKQKYQQKEKNKAEKRLQVHQSADLLLNLSIIESSVYSNFRYKFERKY